MRNFDEAPFLVIWELTQACDLACVHCRACAIDSRSPFELGVATLERRSMARGIGGADPVRCGIPNSDQSRRRGRWL